MFNKIYIEHDVQDLPYTKNIINHFPLVETQYINKVEDIWGRVKKPYLQKRESLNLFIGKKVGELVKETPDAYGIGPEKHYYFIHAYNCIYECQYCYLQGYFNTPDIVLFVNHDDIITEMQAKVDKEIKQDPWFHAGEFSDSLALSNITMEWEDYWKFFKKNPRAKLELRTKSVNIKSIIDLEPLENIYVSFTLASNQGGKEFDLKTPSVKARLKTIEKLVLKGFQIGIHLDPIIYSENFLEEYETMIKELVAVLPDSQLGYLSIGVVRFTKDVYKEVENNYQDSPIVKQNYIKSFDGKVRYSHPMRMWMLNKIKEICILNGISANKIYKCMEEEY